MCRRSKGKFACRRAKENILIGTMQSCSLSNPKADVCECRGNNIKLIECKRDISRSVQTYGLGINRDEIIDEMNLIVELLNVRTVYRYRYTQKRKLILCVPKMQIALVPSQRNIKFNVGPCDVAPKHFNLVSSFLGYEIAQLIIFI